MQHKINISIDDVSPHSESSVKVLEQCHDLIKEFPEIKFTLFVPIAYWRTMGPTATKTPLRIDEHPEFCEVLKLYPPRTLNWLIMACSTEFLVKVTMMSSNT